MKQGLKRKKDEKLGKWCERLATAMTVRMPDAREMQEILHDVSFQSYLEGVEAERAAQRKWKGWE